MPIFCKIYEDLVKVSDSPVLKDIVFDPKNSQNIFDFLNLFFKDKKQFIPERYSRMMQQLSSESICFSYFPNSVVKKMLKDLSETISFVFTQPKVEEYFLNYNKISSFLNNFSRPRPDVEKITKKIKNSKFDGVANNYRAFLPEKDKKSPIVKYSQTSTLTGRLTVKSGPNILTAPSEIRECFKPSKKENKIVQIDLISAEPKFALYSTIGHAPDDVYDYMSSQIFNGKLTREQSKLATLCVLYGQSKRNLSKQIPPTISTSNVIKKSAAYFSSKDMVKNITEQISGNFMKNYFGRPIYLKDRKDSLLINYYLQSSVAEASLIMFSNLCTNNLNITPYYVIHDALIAEVDEEFFNNINKDGTIDLFLENWKFKSKINILSDSYTT